MLRIRVVVAEGHPPLRRVLRHFLEARPELEVVGEATTGEEALMAAVTQRPDVVLVDADLLGPNGFATTRLIKDRVPEAKVVIVTEEDSDDYRGAAQDSGASACIAKDRVEKDLLAVIRSILR